MLYSTRLNAIAIILTSLATSLAGSGVSLAENVLEFPFPEVVQPSREASAQLLTAVSTLFRALRNSEMGDTNGANGQMSEALSLLDQSQKTFEAMAAQMKARNIDYGKAPKEISGTSIDQILGRYNLPKPSTAADLAKIALGEIANLRKPMSEIKFGEKNNSRGVLLRINSALHRTVDIGIVISVLADASF